jgi:hypothetical protein
MQNSQHFLFIDWLAQMEFRQYFSSKGQSSSFLHKEKSNSSTRGITFEEKVFVKLGRAKTRVVHIVAFKA